MKSLCLGTAMWGWSVDKVTAFSLADYYYESGGRYFDTAYNYPINGNIDDFMLSPLYLAEWIELNGICDIKVTFKVGSTSNTLSSQNDLTSDYLLAQIEWARENYGDNLCCIMLHWDNRQDQNEIRETLSILDVVYNHGYEFGLSGIKHPEVYRNNMESSCNKELNIQIKHNFIHDGIRHYENLQPLSPRYWAYGISVSGLKMTEEDYDKNSYVSLVRGDQYHKGIMSPKLKEILSNIIKDSNSIESIYHIAIAYIEQEERLYGYLVAPSTLQQMKDIFSYVNRTDESAVDLSLLREYV